jgi:uncharacterized membrane protein
MSNGTDFSARLGAIEDALARIEQRLSALERERAPRAETPVLEARATAPVAPVAIDRPLPPPAPAEPPRAAIPRPAYRAPAVPRGPSAFDRALAGAREFLFGGNTVVRVGVLVLLIGVALLAKWAVDRELFPIEARLAVAAAIGIALTGIGYRLRDARPGFATTLQGGGVAALYLVVFFAYRYYALVPAPLAFALFVAIALACGVLALAQDSQPLIFIGSVGGFLAPILASTGEDRHVVLFSYYLLLDLGVAAVAWRKAWRALNLLAFVSTYAVATAWGVLSYRPEHFASTEPFVIAYLVLFTAVALVNAWRRPPRLVGMVDGTLVFGTPLVSLLAQARLVDAQQLGMALSTAALGVYYALLATWVWRRAPASLRRIGEAFLALGVAFATIAIPLAIDDALTTTLVWALEGAGLYWVGARQERWLARASGVALQVLAAVAYYWAAQGAAFARTPAFAIANAAFLSSAALALAGLFIAREAYALRARLADVEWQLAQVLALWGLAWWAGAWAREIDRFLPASEEVAAALLVTSATFLALERAAARLAWLPGRLFALGLIPAGFIALPIALAREEYLFAGSSGIAWPLVLVSIYVVLHRLEGCGEPRTNFGYAPALWLVALVLGFGLAGVVDAPLRLHGDWPIASFAIGPVVALLGAQQLLERGIGPFWRFARLHIGAGAAPIAALSALWFLAINRRAHGDPAAPLSYLPLVNPADIALALLGVALVDWWLRLQRTRPPVLPGEWRKAVAPGFAALGFVWLNGVLARSVVQWTGVPFDAGALWDSTPFQSALSISWTLVALAAMVWSTRRSMRRAWIAAATLLGVTVVKLFLVDLSTLSTGAKIGTFLVVGALLLVVGYLSPVPPAAAGGAQQESEA